MHYWGAKGYVARPPLNLFGGLDPPCPPVFLRVCDPILALESTDVFMEECADMLQVVLVCPTSLNKLVLKFGSPDP